MKYILHILFTFLVQNTIAQTNLVPNGSFEELDSCPGSTDIEGQINALNFWFRPTLATPDYHSEICYSDYAMGAPLNFAGYQYAQDGLGYIGIVAYSNMAPNWREYIEVKLKQTLEQGVTYYWSYYVSLSEMSKKSTKNIEIAFLDDELTDFNTEITLNINTVISSDIFFDDTLNWMKISGKYLASGNEDYLILGNFKLDSMTTLSDVIPNLTFSNLVNDTTSYYYIDNVQLCKGDCNIDFNVPNVFTPNDDGVNDMFTLNNQNINLSNISIYNRWGNQVYYSENQIDWDGTFNQKKCSDGVYFYVLYYYQNNQLKSKQGTIHLIR